MTATTDPGVTVTELPPPTRITLRVADPVLRKTRAKA